MGFLPLPDWKLLYRGVNWRWKWSNHKRLRLPGGNTITFLDRKRNSRREHKALSSENFIIRINFWPFFFFFFVLSLSFLSFTSGFLPFSFHSPRWLFLCLATFRSLSQFCLHFATTVMQFHILRVHSLYHPIHIPVGKHHYFFL